MKSEADDTKLKSSFKKKKLDEATEVYVLATKRARREGVDVAGVHLEVQEQSRLSFVKYFGATLGLISAFFWPNMIPFYKMFCFKMGMPYDLPEWYYYWPCVLGTVSILAFAFDLVDPRTHKRISGPSDSKKLERQHISRSGKFTVYEPEENEDDGNDGSV